MCTAGLPSRAQLIEQFALQPESVASIAIRRICALLQSAQTTFTAFSFLLQPEQGRAQQAYHRAAADSPLDHFNHQASSERITSIIRQVLKAWVWVHVQLDHFNHRASFERITSIIRRVLKAWVWVHVQLDHFNHQTSFEIITSIIRRFLKAWVWVHVQLHHFNHWGCFKSDSACTAG